MPQASPAPSEEPVFWDEANNVPVVDHRLFWSRRMATSNIHRLYEQWVSDNVRPNSQWNIEAMQELVDDQHTVFPDIARTFGIGTTTEVNERSDMDRSSNIRLAIAAMLETHTVPNWNEPPYDGEEILRFSVNPKNHDLWILNTYYNAWLAFIDPIGKRINLRQRTIYRGQFVDWAQQHGYRIVQPQRMASRGELTPLHRGDRWEVTMQ